MRVQRLFWRRSLLRQACLLLSLFVRGSTSVVSKSRRSLMHVPLFRWSRGSELQSTRKGRERKDGRGREGTSRGMCSTAAKEPAGLHAVAHANRACACPFPPRLPSFLSSQCLASFLRIPAQLAMVDVADKLFYPSRPSHVAPLYPRSSGDANNSLSLSMTEGDEGRSSPESCQRRRRPLSGKSCSSTNRGGGGAGRPRSRVGAKGKRGAEEEEQQQQEGFPARKGQGGGAGKTGDHGSGPPVTVTVTQKGGRRRRRPSRVTTVGGGAPESREGLLGALPSREDVTYTAKTLRLRRARGEGGPLGGGQKR